MSSVKITKFLGTSPKTSSELLPDTAAQIARNCKLYSGDLIPYPQPTIVDNSMRNGVVRTLYALTDPDTFELKWLTWNTQVDIATPATNAGDQRFYYTGDGVPKVSTYALATDGAAPYPINYYDLGLQLPTIKPVAAATAFTPTTSASFARDAGNNVTLVMGSNHNLKNGATATISNFSYRTGTYSRTGTLITVTITGHGLATGAEILLEFTSGTATTNNYSVTVTDADNFTCNDGASGATSGNVRWDIRDLNTTTEITVINDTTISYYASGPQVQTTANTTGKLDLGGQIQSRSYLYTWYTPWLEESIGSEPSEALFIKEGQIVSVSNLPSAPPNGNNFIRGMKLYRTLSGTTDADYFRLNTLWFPMNVTQVERASGISTVTLDTPHNFIVGDRFRIKNCSVNTFNVSGQIVTSVVDDYTFEYDQVASDISLTDVTGKLYHDVSESPPDSTARYFGLVSGTYTQTASTTITVTMAGHGRIVGDSVVLDFLTGDGVDGTYTVVTATATTFTVTAATSTTTNGLVEAELYIFIDDFNYRSLLSTLTSNENDPPPVGMKGLVSIQNNILAGFVGNELYLTDAGIFHAWPEKYKRSFDSPIVGLAQIGGSLLVLTETYPYVVAGTDPAVLSIARLSSRYPCLNRKSIVETSFGVVYATHDGLAVYAPSIAGQLLTRQVHSSDTWNASLDPSQLVGVTYKDLYFASSDTGSIIFENPSKTSAYDTTGPTFVDSDFTFSAAWYDPITNNLYLAVGENGDIYQWDDLAQPYSTMQWKSKTLVTKDFTNLGAARVVADYTDEEYTTVWNFTDDVWGESQQLWNAVEPIVFSLYVNKNLIFTTECSNSNVFRLPSGYRSDTFEVELESLVRVRAVHLGETPISLRTS